MAGKDELGVFIKVKVDPASINRMIKEIEAKMRSFTVRVSTGTSASGKSSVDMSKDIAQVQRSQTAFNNLSRQINNYLSTNGKIKAQNGDTYRSFTSLQGAIQKGNISLSEARLKYSQLTAQTKSLGLQNKTFGQSIKEAFGRYAAIGVATTGLLMIKQTLKKMVVAVKELDKSIVDLQIATGMTYTQAKALLSTYTELGKQMGATTVQVAQAADSFLRQGYSIADSNELVKQSLMLSKLGQIDSAESTKYLTSAMKGYKVEVADTAGIVDKLTAVDMEAAVTSGGIAEAMSMTANGARLAGVDMNKLIGIMTATGEVSQAEMSKIGTAYKTMFARMSNVKLGRMEDEEGVDITTEINEVEKVLNKIGIPLRKSATEWNNFGDVLDQIGAKWNTLNGIQKSAITTGLGGVRQKEFATTLFENYDKALKYEKTALESSGTAIKKYEDAYLGGIEAKSAKLKASFESLSMSFIGSGLVGGITDAVRWTLEWVDGTNRLGTTAQRALVTFGAIYALVKRSAIASAVSGLAQYGSTIGAFGAGGTAGLKALTAATQGLSQARLMNVISTNSLNVSEASKLLIGNGVERQERIAILTKLGYIKTQNTQTISTTGAIAATKGLGLALKDAAASMIAFLATNPVGWAILAAGAIAGVTFALKKFSLSTEEAAESLRESSQKLAEAKDSVKSLETEISNTIERIAELKKAADSGTITLVEQVELDTLKKTNEELERRIILLRTEKDEAQGKANEDAKALYHSMSDTYMGYDESGKMGAIEANLKLLWNDWGMGFEFTNVGVEEFVDSAVEQMARLDSSSTEYATLREALVPIIKNYQKVVDDLNPTNKAEQAMLDSVNLQLDKMAYAFGTVSEKAAMLEKVSARMTKSDLTKYLKSIGMSADEVSRYMKDFAGESRKAIDPITEMNKSISDLKTTMDGLPERMEDLESINKKVSDGYHFSISEIDEIIKKYPQLESAVTRTAYGFQIADGAINTLSTGISFTSEEIKFLESAHGSLNATLDEATGLYYLNSDALSALGISAIQAKIDYNQFQIDSTKSAMEGARARIEALQAETSALSAFAAASAIAKQSGDTGTVLTSNEFWMMKRDGLASVAGYSNYDEYTAGRISKTSGSQVQAMKDAQKQLEEYQSQLDRIGTGSVSGYTPEKSGKAKTAEELLKEQMAAHKAAFEAQKAIIDRQLALNLITEEQYTNSLESLYKQFYSDKSKYLDEYTQYEIEVYNKRQSLIEQAEKEIEAARAAHKSAFEAAKAPLDRQLDLDLMTEKQYVDKLEALYKSYFSDKSQYLDEYTKYEVEVYKKRKSLLEQAEKDAEQARKDAEQARKDAEQAQKDAESAHKAAFEAAKAALERQLDLNLITEKQYIDSLESLYKRYFSDKSKYLDEYTRYEVEVYKKRQALLEQAQKDIDAIRQAAIEMIKQEKKADKEALEAKKNSLKEYIDARKQALSDARDQDRHDKSIRDQSSDIENIQARLMGLSGDTSAAGMRKKLELRDQLVQAQEKLSETVADKEYSMQIKALEDSQKVQEDKINSQIESIDKFLNNQENLVRASLDRMNGMSYQLKSDLIAYTKEYGDGIADNITKSWEAATEALRQYGSVANIQGTMGTITTHIGGAAGDVPREYAKGTSGLPRDSIIVGTHELLLNKNQDGRYQMMSAGSPIFTESQVEGLKKLLGSPSFSTNKQLGGVGSTATASVVSMVNSNNANNVEIHYEMNISGTNPEGIASEIDKHLPRISDYTMNRVNKDILINKGVRRSAGSLN